MSKPGSTAVRGFTFLFRPLFYSLWRHYRITLAPSLVALKEEFSVPCGFLCCRLLVLQLKLEMKNKMEKKNEEKQLEMKKLRK